MPTCIMDTSWQCDYFKLTESDRRDGKRYERYTQSCLALDSFAAGGNFHYLLV